MKQEIFQLLGKGGLQQQEQDGNFSFVSHRRGGPTFDSLAHVQERLLSEGLSNVFPRASLMNQLDESDRVNLRFWATTGDQTSPNMVSPEAAPSCHKNTAVRNRAMSTLKGQDGDDDESMAESDDKIEEDEDRTQSPAGDTRLEARDSASYMTANSSEHVETELHLFEQTGHSNFRCEIFPLLNKAFSYRRNEYRLEGEIIGSDVDVRLWICRHGVPNQQLTQQETQRLHTWASYALVKLSDLNQLVTEYSDADVEQVLLKLNVRRSEDDGQYHARGGSWDSLADVARVVCTQGAQSIHRSAFTKLSEEEQANLRLWAARCNCRRVRTFSNQDEDQETADESTVSSSASQGNGVERQQDEEEEANESLPGADSTIVPSMKCLMLACRLLPSRKIVKGSSRVQWVVFGDFWVNCFTKVRGRRLPAYTCI